MAHRVLTNETASFAEWYAELERYAASRGGSVADVDAWREDYDAGKTPMTAYCDEWGWE